MHTSAFVGRVRELEQLEGILDAAREGEGAAVLVAGEAGIGKTRLASEAARRVRDTGFEVLLGRSIDLVGSELPYQPFAEALRPVGEVARAGSQLRVFEDVLELLTERATPVLLVLEDLHWADTSTLDLVVFLAHNLAGRRIVLLATHRPDERMRRLADGVRRSGAGLVLELGPLTPEELAALVAARDAPAAVIRAIVARSEGNPFFAEELLAAADPGGELPRGLREALLARVAGLDRDTQTLLRAAAAAGREVSYAPLRAVAARDEDAVRESLRAAVEHGVLVADQAGRAFRFRHALLAEAIYSTILPGEREDLHARLADALSRDGAAPAELAPHWAAAGRAPEALAASVAAARDAEAVFGLAEALAHLERALALWGAVDRAEEPAGLGLGELCSWSADLASQTGDAPRAVELVRKAIELAGEGDPLRASLLHQRLGRYLFESGTGAIVAPAERAVTLVPEQPPSRERAQALTSLASALTVVWRHDESLAVCEQALELACAVGARELEVEARARLASSLAYLGRAGEGLAEIGRAVALAEEFGEPRALYGAYVILTDVLTMLGRPREAAAAGERGLDALRPFETDRTVLSANWIEALLAIGEWDAADAASAAALRGITANYPHMPLILRADLELGRGDFDAAHAHIDAARATIRHDAGLATYDGYVAELAVWERRWTEAGDAVRSGLARARPEWGAQIRVWLCAKGLRAHADLAALARARHDDDAAEHRVARARALVAEAREAAAAAAAITPNAGGWLTLAEAEHERAQGAARPELWAAAALSWEELERPPVVAYCRWREAEALVAAGAARAEATEPLRTAHAIALRLGARPLLAEIERLAERARLDPAPLDAGPPRGELEELLGLTPREAEVLALVARGLTNREIAGELVISTKTAGVHVSNILRKLDAPNRREAAAIAHRLAPGQPSSSTRSAIESTMRDAR